MKLVAGSGVRGYVDEHGGAVYIWPRTIGCCRGRTHVLEAATEPPNGEFELLHAADGFRIYASVGLVQPAELHLDVRGGHVRASWNGQAWIG